MAIVRKTTRELIFEAFEIQLKTTPFENIRVSSICQECGIQRPHFYYYFNDKYDLSCCYFIERMIKNTEAELASQASLQKIMDVNFRTILENKLVYQRLMQYRGAASMFAKLSEFTHDSVMLMLKSWNGDIKLTGQEAEHLKFYCHAINDILSKWYMEDMAAPPEDLIKLVCDNIPVDLKKYFR